MCPVEIGIRPIRGEEIKEFRRTLRTAFGWGEPPEGSEERDARMIDPARMLAAFQDGSMVGVGGAFPFRMTVPGGEASTAGVTQVGVLPTHRRRGILTALMRRLLDDALERGEPLAYLWASEDQIYPRYGYGMASSQGEIELRRDRAAFLDPGAPQGRVRLIELDEALQLVPGIYERARRLIPGMYARSHQWWELRTLYDPPESREGGSRLAVAMWEMEGEAEAYCLYRTHGSWSKGAPTGRLDVIEAIGTSPVATKEIWQFLLGVDLHETIRAWFLPADHPLRFLLAEPRRLKFTLVQNTWLRLIDVKAALEARSYACDGTIVFDVSDRFRPANGGCWRLEASAGAAATERTGGRADLTVSINDLGATYLGGFSFSELAAAGRVQESSPGAAFRADSLFRTPRAPWCPEVF